MIDELDEVVLEELTILDDTELDVTLDSDDEDDKTGTELELDVTLDSDDEDGETGTELELELVEAVGFKVVVEK